MTDNVQLLSDELRRLDYEPEPFECQIDVCSGQGVKFQYRIVDGSRVEETVMLGLVIPDQTGDWPEITPHWLHICPPDNVLAEQVMANRGNAQGVVRRYQDKEGTEWMAISAPVNDFWDQIEDPDGKNMSTYIERHVRRIWDAR